MPTGISIMDLGPDEFQLDFTGLNQDSWRYGEKLKGFHVVVLTTEESSWV